MKRIAIFLALGSLILSASAATPPKSEEREYSFMTAKPYRSEVQLGQQRLAKFLSRLNPKRRTLLDQTPYVAVQVYVLTAGEVPGLDLALRERVRPLESICAGYCEWGECSGEVPSNLRLPNQTVSRRGGCPGYRYSTA